MPRHRHLKLILFVLVFSILLLHIHRMYIFRRKPLSLATANATLGFGTIIAVSHATSPRRAGLLWAANLTDLEIVIPEQPEHDEDDIKKFKAKTGSVISKGSARAWLGHLNALQWFIHNTTHTTALVIEDDADFSLHIRTQIALFASALRSLLSPSTTAFYPPPSTYAILYPGHCDDLPSPLYASHPHTFFRDPTAPPAHMLHPATETFLSSLNVPAHTRLLHRAFYPFCTFAYAVHRGSAEWILSELAREKEGGTSAFDVALLEACRDWDRGGYAGEAWKCWSVAPEVFHHQVGGSEIYKVDLGIKGEYRRPERGTWNIEPGCAARGREFWVDKSDEAGRAEVKALVQSLIERGECFGGRGDEDGWVGCEEEDCGAQS